MNSKLFLLLLVASLFLVAATAHGSTTRLSVRLSAHAEVSPKSELAEVQANAQGNSSTGLANHRGKLIFRDEFNGTAVDLTKWRLNVYGNDPNAITKPSNSWEEQCIDPKVPVVTNGELRITVVQDSCTVPDVATPYAYRGGFLYSMGKFEFSYGYAEARIWVDVANNVISNWPAWWMTSPNWPEGGEIDVMEGLKGKPCWHFHYGTRAAPLSQGGCAPFANPGGWHTYAVDWRPNSMIFYYDGIQVGKVTQGITAGPMRLALGMSVSTQISPPIIVPTTMIVDYVRVWRRGN